MIVFRPFALAALACFLNSASASAIDLFGGILNREEKKVLSSDQLSTQEGSASSQLQKARQYESSGKKRQALDTYKSITKSYPRTASAAEAKFGYARMLEAEGEGRKAFEQYQELLSNYPNSPHFNEAVQRQFGIADGLKNNPKKGIFGIGAAIQPSKLIEMFDYIAKISPQSEYAPRSLLSVGYIHEEAGETLEAIGSFQKVVDGYAETKFATEAQYEIFKLRGVKADSSNSPVMDRAQVEAGIDFVNQNPEDQRAAEVKKNLDSIEERTMGKLYETALFYEKSGKPISARRYYEEIVKNPNTSWASKAQARLNVLDGAEDTVEKRAGFFGPNPLKKDKVEMRTSDDDLVPLPTEE